MRVSLSFDDTVFVPCCQKLILFSNWQHKGMRGWWRGEAVGTPGMGHATKWPVDARMYSEDTWVAVEQEAVPQ
jgi:hypothetical protein